ncbi:MAG: hypothetical protein IPL53_21650 [Ignavibacteria bacterium]|nr:hypothetical protein [Ignavibacteria bacterium]
MKDKSRFVSSVIVSLLAGFIYYMFGQDINENVQSSIKAALSSNEMEEQYLSSDYFPVKSISDNSVIKSKKKNSKFYIKKRNTIEFQNNGITVPGEELFSDFVKNNQAKFDRPVPDKDTDFTAELNELIKTDRSKSRLKPLKELSDLLKNKNDEVADTKRFERRSEKMNKNFEQSQIKTYNNYRKGDAEYKGNGFEYNYVTGNNSSQSNSNSNGINYTAPGNEKKTDCKNYKVEYKRKTKIINGKRTEIITPKVHINNNDENEININVDNDNENSCN